MELRWWTVLVVCAAVSVRYGLADGDGPLKTPCTGESCSAQDGAARPPGPRVVESKAGNQRQSVIVVKTDPKEVEKSHRQRCTNQEKRISACLKGECFVVDFGDVRSPSCQCPPMYEGVRCEKLSAYFFLSYSAEMKKAGIIAGVFFLLVVIIVSVSVYFSVKKGHMNESCHLQKFSDDSAVVGCILENDEETYREQVSLFVSWCEDNFLELNVKKTKEVIIDFRRKKEAVEPVTIKDQPIEIVSEYRYLGVLLDDKLNWSAHTNVVFRKLQTRLYFLRKLRSFHVCNKMLYMFYQSVLCSVLTFATVCWGGNVSARDAGRLNKIVRRASSIVGQRLDLFEVLVEKRLARKTNTILRYPEHPLHEALSGRCSTFSGRFTMPKCKTERFRCSFIPAAIRYLNSAGKQPM